jgi:hypothetical protein
VYITVVCTPVVVVLTVLAEIVNVIATIPIIGNIYRWIFGSLVWIGSQFVGLVDAGLSLLGIHILKHLRLRVVVLMREDGSLTVNPDDITAVTRSTDTVPASRSTPQSTSLTPPQFIAHSTSIRAWASSGRI